MGKKSDVRWYDRFGRDYISVTSVLKLAVAKPALVGWAAKVAAEAGRSGAPFAKSRNAALRGKDIHQWIEAQATGGREPDFDPTIVGYLDAAQRFLTKYKVKFLMSEQIVYHDGEMYAGTMDAMAEITLPDSGRQIVTILDWKTVTDAAKLQKWPPYDENHMQLEAYRRAYLFGQPIQPVECVGVVRLPPSGAGTFHMWGQPYNDRAWEGFRSALQLARHLLSKDDDTLAAWGNLRDDF